MTRYPDELRNRATRAVLETKTETESITAACRRVGEAMDIHPRTLHAWVKRGLTGLNHASPIAPRPSPDDTGQTTTESKAILAPPSAESRSHRVAWKTAWRDLGGAIAGAVVAGIGQAVGVAHLAPLVFLFLGTELALIGAFFVHALQAHTDKQKTAGWRRAFAVLVLLPLGMGVYHAWLDPSAKAPTTYPLVVDGDETKVVYLYGEAGGQPQIIATGGGGQNGLIGGQTYLFECSVQVDGSQWLRYERFGQEWWAPRKDLHPPAGLPAPAIPHC